MILYGSSIWILKDIIGYISYYLVLFVAEVLRVNKLSNPETVWTFGLVVATDAYQQILQ